MPTGIYQRSEEQLERLRRLSHQPRSTRGGGYSAIHHWLVKNFGKPNKCESPTCKKISERFHWCLLKGEEYSHDRKKFIQMCSSCHRLYDQTPEWIKKAVENKTHFNNQYTKKTNNLI